MTVVAAIVMAVGTVIAALMTGLFGLVNEEADGADKNGAPTSCEGQRVDLKAPAEVGPTYDLQLTINCAPQPGEKYILIAELTNVGKPGTEHTLYCPRLEPDPEIGAKSYRRTNGKSPIGSVRTLYVYSVTPEQEQIIDSSPVDGDCVAALPQDADKVSNSVQVKRTW
ncbi:hypothetical protein BGM19_00550 [Streptomyces agglomeratus]|nr:hypothetical protein BGM19_00550 [Streptomyces agglomeratus]